MKLLATVDRRLQTIKASNGLSGSLKKAVRTKDDSPKDKHIACVLDHAREDTTSSSFSNLITSLPLAYRPPVGAMQSYADAASPGVNSAQNKSSGAYARVVLEGLQAFKALYILHRLLEESPDSAAEEHFSYNLWIITMIAEIERRPNSEGFGDAFVKYAKYLQARLELQVSRPSSLDLHDLCSSSADRRGSITEHENELLCNMYDALSALRADLQARLASGSRQRIVKLALKAVAADVDVMESTG